MLRPRIIPCLLVRNKGLVKTVKFSEPKYIGDPINAVKIFNEKRVDELIVLDISATTNNTSPDFKMIEHLAAESQMPLCYGGGITNTTQAKTIVSLGVEKVALSTAILDRPRLVTQLADEIGSQSVVAILDVKRRLLSKKYEIWSNNGRVNTGKCPVEFSKILQECGVGEIVINSIDNDGVMKGYDLALVKKIHEQITVPMTILGGAGALDDIVNLINNFGTIGAAAGSLFVFKGPYKAVLINYPSFEEKDKLMTAFFNKQQKQNEAS
jgi:cyclase